MSVYFNYFPNTTHSGKLLKAITRRVDFADTIFANPYVFLPYTIDGDDRAEDIALYYYGDMRYTWLVWLSNNVIDPYHQWPMNYDDFNKYIIKKYSSLSGETGYDVIAWTQDETSNTNIMHYKNVDDPDLQITVDTYNSSIIVDKDEWQPVRYYAYEEELNDNRRTINLIDSTYKTQAETELRELLNNDTR